MQTEDQADTIAFLSDPLSYGLPPTTAIERTRTHISEVFLAGDRAYKLKRAVQLPYADFSTATLRHAACLREVELNRRTAPSLYLGTRDIRQLDGSVGFGDKGDLIDTVVEMQRFRRDDLFDHMAGRGVLTADIMTATAAMIARFHQEADICRAGSGARAIARVLDINETAFSVPRSLPPVLIDKVNTACRNALARHSELLDRRFAMGMVRRCHGDLHLRNICLWEGEPTAFDCIEFSDEIAIIDVLYDLAFLLMDLWHRGLFGWANVTMNRYFDLVQDDAGLPLLSFFMAVRASIRAHVTAAQAEEDGSDPGLRMAARDYLELASRLLESHPSELIAIGGLSGSGKSSVAEAIASSIGAPPGARVLESDRIRKQMFHVSVETKLPDSAYESHVSELVYRTMAENTERLLQVGIAVVANAVFDREADRNRIMSSANQADVPFTGIWLDAPAAILRKRIAQRVGGASDADLRILSQQLENLPSAPAEWTTIAADRALDLIVTDVLKIARSGFGQPGRPPIPPWTN